MTGRKLSGSAPSAIIIVDDDGRSAHLHNDGTLVGETTSAFIDVIGGEAHGAGELTAVLEFGLDLSHGANGAAASDHAFRAFVIIALDVEAGTSGIAEGH